MAASSQVLIRDGGYQAPLEGMEGCVAGADLLISHPVIGLLEYCDPRIDHRVAHAATAG